MPILLNFTLTNHPKANLHRRGWFTLAAIALLIMATLACDIFGPGVRSAERTVVVNHLPTLTRTPLPTLSPTLNPTTIAATMLAEVAAMIPSPTHAGDTSIVTITQVPTAINTPTAPVEVLSAGVAPVEAAPAPDAAAADVPMTNSPATTEPLPPTEPPPPTPTIGPTSTSPPTDTPTPPPLPEGWVFADIRLSPAPDGHSQLISGNLINNTGSPQILDAIDGQFYDNQGQMINNIFYTLDYPINEIPQGGWIPFQIEVKDRTNTADVKLQALAGPGSDAPRQDFEFLDVNASPQGDEYCVAGKVRNPGSKLGSYLVIAAVLYDDQDKVINYYYDYFDEALLTLTGEQTQDVSICVDPLQQEVAHYELEAWGL